MQRGIFIYRERGFILILNQKLIIENDERRTARLLTTYDTSLAQELVREANESGGGRVGSGSGEMRLMGYIPPEMWNYDPWLLLAKRARNAGDIGEYTKYVRKFFDVHREFQVITPKKYWNGSSSKKE